MAFTKKRYLDILHAQVPATLTDANIYIPGSVLDAALFSAVRSDFGDFRISTDEPGLNEIPTDLTDHDTGSSKLEMHTKGGTINGSSNTRLWLHYGDPALTRPADSAANGRNAVWDNSVSMRLSMKETSGDFIDSTGNGLDAARTVLVATDKDGHIEDGQKLNATDYLTVPDDTLLRPGSGDFTISFLLKCNGLLSSSSHQYRLFGKGNADGFNQTGFKVQMEGNSNGLRFKVASGFSSSNLLPSSNQKALLANGNWNLIDIVVDQGAAQEGTMYINGSSVGTTNSIINCAPTDDLLIGKHSASTKSDAVWMDEIRIYQRALSVHEIGWKYNNIFNPGTCFSLGPEIDLGGKYIPNPIYYF